MNVNDDFYVVWNPQAGPPTYRHQSFDAAKGEAERLARANPGQEFFVLGTMGRAHAEPLPSIFSMSKSNSVDIPF